MLGKPRAELRILGQLAEGHREVPRGGQGQARKRQGWAESSFPHEIESIGLGGDFKQSQGLA